MWKQFFDRLLRIQNAMRAFSYFQSLWLQFKSVFFINFSVQVGKNLVQQKFIKSSKYTNNSR